MAAGRPDGAERLAERCQCWRRQRSRVVMDTRTRALFSVFRLCVHIHRQNCNKLRCSKETKIETREQKQRFEIVDFVLTISKKK